MQTIYIFGKGLLSKILNSTAKSPYIIPIKMGKGPEKTFVQSRYTRAHEKMLRIAKYQRNANENTMNYHCQTVRMARIKKEETTIATERRRKGSPSKPSVALQTGTATVESSTEGPQKTKITTTRRSSFGVFIQRKQKY